jgi:glucokinase
VTEAIGLDIGGTKIAAVLIAGDAGQVLERRTVPTPATEPGEIVRALVGAATGLMTNQVRAIGIGAAGMVDRAGIVRYAPNLAYRDIALGSLVREAVGVPCHVENDGNAAAWAEYRFGAGRGVRDLLFVGVGTGIGGGIVSDGHLYRGMSGFAAEIGHIVVEPDGPLCGCGNRGCWEQLASGSAIQRLGRARAREHPDSLPVSMAGGDPEAVTGAMVTRAAHLGDEIAVRVLAEVGGRLGEGIAGLVNVLDPEVVVIGGGGMDAGELLLGPARSSFKTTVEAPGSRSNVPLRPAELGADAGGVGAALLALEELGS